MFDITSFLLRWMFLANLCRNVDEIQNLPMILPETLYNDNNDRNVIQPTNSYSGAPPPPSVVASDHVRDPNIQPMFSNGAATTPENYPTTHKNNNIHNNNWKTDYIHNILVYPPNSFERLTILDNLRSDLVYQLRNRIKEDDDILRHWKSLTRNHNNPPLLNQNEPVRNEQQNLIEDDTDNNLCNVIQKELEADQKEATIPDSLVNVEIAGKRNFLEQTSLHQPHVPNKRNETQEDLSHLYNTKRLQKAREHINQIRDCLPQLVSTILKSPSSFTRRHVDERYYESNPSFHSAFLRDDVVADLRDFILQRFCVKDPDCGIRLCWLLEAEVGNAWKTLLETSSHRRRLIFILPADLALILAKVGITKKLAFQLLQDIEQATAYGSYSSLHPEQPNQIDKHRQNQYTATDPFSSKSNANPSVFHEIADEQLPSALRVLRCKFYGDTMQFIDQLTLISTKMRRCFPVEKRIFFLKQQLNELNRRVRRRMISYGAITLDTDDESEIMMHRNDVGYEWPAVHDLTTDMLQYSIYLPIIPQSLHHVWPTTLTANLNEETNDFVTNAGLPPKRQGGSNSVNTHENQVARILNIVVDKTRILASRERCPFLIHVEVADSGYEGNDLSLYATNSETYHPSHEDHEYDGGYATIQEALTLQNIMNPSSNDEEQTEVDTPASHTTYSKDAFVAWSKRQQSPWGVIQSSSEGSRGPVSENNLDSSMNTFSVEQMNRSPIASRGGHYDNGAEYHQHIPDQGIGTSHYHYSGSNQEYSAANSFVTHPPVSGQSIPQDAMQYSSYNQLNSMPDQPQEQFYYSEQDTNRPMEFSSSNRISLGETLLEVVFGKVWHEQCQEIRNASPFGNIKGWRLASFIIKAGEDIRREALVMQIITKLRDWFREIPIEHRPFLRPYNIMCVGGDAGVVECITDAKSIDEIKKNTDAFLSLRDFFERAFGPPIRNQGTSQPGNPHYSSHLMPGRPGVTFEVAQDNFLRSLVGYSLVCYILQIKDRHNANILMDRVGHVIHIDYGFVLGDTPKMGKVPIFSERAPFKLSQEFWEVLGGWGGRGVRFCQMFELAFACASKHADEIATLVESTMLLSISGDGFSSTNERAHILAARACANSIRSRLRMRGTENSTQQKMFIMDLVNAALTSWGTTTYDWLQRNMNGYQ